jgi:hypothetical protein
LTRQQPQKKPKPKNRLNIQKTKKKLKQNGSNAKKNEEYQEQLRTLKRTEQHETQNRQDLVKTKAHIYWKSCNDQ